MLSRGDANDQSEVRHCDQRQGQVVSQRQLSHVAGIEEVDPSGLHRDVLKWPLSRANPDSAPKRNFLPISHPTHFLGREAPLISAQRHLIGHRGLHCPSADVQNGGASYLHGGCVKNVRPEGPTYARFQAAHPPGVARGTDGRCYLRDPLGDARSARHRYEALVFTRQIDMVEQEPFPVGGLQQGLYLWSLTEPLWPNMLLGLLPRLTAHRTLPLPGHDRSVLLMTRNDNYVRRVSKGPGDRRVGWPYLRRQKSS